MRTTITLPAPLLRRIRDISHRRRTTITAVIREYVDRGVQSEKPRTRVPSPFRDSPTLKNGALIDYTDKETLSKLFDKYP